MPININSHKIGEVIDTLKDVGKRYHSQLVFQHFLLAGYALWTGPNGFISSYADVDAAPEFSDMAANAELLVNQSVPLNQPITKLKTGATININPKALTYWYRTSGNSWSSYDLHGDAGANIVATTVSLADLKSRTPVKIATGTFMDMAVVAVDDTHLKFFNQKNATAAQHEYQNSTLIGWGDDNYDSAFRSFLIIDNITAY